MKPHFQNFHFDSRVAGLTLAELRYRASKEVNSFNMLPMAEQAMAMFTGTAARAVVNDLNGSIVDEYEPDVIITMENEFGSPLVAKIRNIPNVTVGLSSPPRPASAVKRLHLALSQLWHDMDVPLEYLGGIYRTLYLETCPPSLSSQWWSPHLRNSTLMRPECVSEGSSSLMPIIDIAPTVRVIHLTFGTVVSEKKNLHQVLDALLELRNVKVIVTTKNPLGSYASTDVVVSDFISHGNLLPVCDLVICHGGNGTSIASLIHGIPLMISPQGGASQYRNAVACDARGVGLHVPAERLSTSVVQIAARELLHRDTYKRNALEVASEISNMPSPSAIVGRIERILEN
jgi:hypothetical protein